MLFDILFIFISTLSAKRCPQSTVYSPPSTVYQTSNLQTLKPILRSNPRLRGDPDNSRYGGTHPIQNKLYTQNKPNLGKDGNAPTSLLLTTNDQRLATREAQNKPKQTQFFLSYLRILSSADVEIYGSATLHSARGFYLLRLNQYVKELNIRIH